MNTDLPTTVLYRSVPRHSYCVSYIVVCITTHQWLWQDGVMNLIDV